MNGVKEIKVENINYHIFNNIKKIRQIIYEILAIICYKSDKNINNQNLDINEINQKLDELWKNSKICLEVINAVLNIINDNRYLINADYLKNLYVNKCYNILYEDINLNYLLYKNLINNTNNFFLRQLIKNEMKNIEFQIRIRNLNYNMQKNLESRHINEWIKEFIINNFKDKIGEKQIKENGQYLHNIHFNCEIEPYKLVASIKIDILNFHIYIEYPVQKDINTLFLYNKIKVSFKFKYCIEDGLESQNSLDKNRKYELNDIKEKKFLLIEKIKKLFEERIYQINQAIYEEARNILKKSYLNLLIEFCKRFIYYIYDYNKLFKTKCSVCEKVVKYSVKEKCFFPPYYKIYRERNNKINEDNLKLFYHEECFRKIALPYL